MKSFSLLSTFLTALLVAHPLQAQYALLHSFTSSPVKEPQTPLAGLVQGTDGNFYGMSQFGGDTNNGAFFKVTSTGTVTVPHSFVAGGGGSQPSTVLNLNPDGNFYGTTMSGGAINNAGTIFKMTPAGVETVLHNFDSGAGLIDGVSPHAGLTLAGDGNYYGTTFSGGATNIVDCHGTVFKITPAGVYTVIYRFGHGSVANDGSGPMAGLVLGTDGLLYGTTSVGGKAGKGTVFSISTAGVVKILHHFGDGTIANDGSDPEATLLLDKDGFFYGTTRVGGSANQGTIFKISPAGVMTILHHFQDGSITGQDGIQPTSGLIRANDGNLYGVTTIGGTSSYSGTLYRITAAGVYSILHRFLDGSVASDGVYPRGELIQATDGNLYGLTSAGGTGTNGTFFKFALEKIVTAPPVISGATKVSTAVGKVFSYQITATNTPDSYTATGLPKGITLNAATGLLSGSSTTVGTYAVTLGAKNAKGSATYSLAITVAQGTQKITFGAIPSQLVGGKLALTATASSGLAITYNLVSGPATISGRVLTFTGAGVVTVRADQPGNAAYKPAASVSESIVVKKKTQTITFGTIPNKVLGAAPFTLTGQGLFRASDHLHHLGTSHPFRHDPDDHRNRLHPRHGQPGGQCHLSGRDLRGPAFLGHGALTPLPG